MRQFQLDAIRQFEGFSARATWDYKQHTNGFGTRAKFPGEIIDRAEAERRFNADSEDARLAVSRFAPHLDQGTEAALTSLTFNAGTSWMRAGLGAAIKSGDFDTARSIFKMYTYAGGQSLRGLEARRQVEAQWFGQGASDALKSQDFGTVATQSAAALPPTEKTNAETVATAPFESSSKSDREAFSVDHSNVAGADPLLETAPWGLSPLFLAILTALSNIESIKADGWPYADDGPLRNGDEKDHYSMTT